MGKMYKFEHFLEEEELNHKIGNRFRYIKMAFKPCGTIFISLLIAFIVAVPCIIILYLSESGSIMYDVSMAILTGVIASAIVSVSIEASNNYRRNRQRLIVLHEYLYVVSMYENFMQRAMKRLSFEYTSTDGDDPLSDELSLRQRVVADIELDIVPPVDKALEIGREYLSRKELELMEQIIDASNSIAIITDEIIDNNLIDRCYSAYDILKEPFKTKITEFSEEVKIQIFDENLRAVVFDYVMSNLELVNDNSKFLMKLDLKKIDTCMLQLRKIVKNEPVYYEYLIPFEKRFKKMRIR